MTLQWKPAQPLSRVALEGELVRLEPVDVARHAGQLFAAQSSAPELWEYLPYGPFANETAFRVWLTERAATSDPLFYAIIERKSGRALGMASFLRIEQGHGVIEVGHIWYSPALQRTRLATDAMYVMARHVFDDLGYRRYEWKCNALNEPSRRAAVRLGFTFEGVFRQHMVIKGENRDTAWYSMLDGEWPAAKAAFEAWLRPDNFDADGRQLRSLAELRMVPGQR
ncbi:MAG: GNAT family N-acetyltransferase [Chloroflexi bacterium]|nr:MAG: GNAT family N-acetyltransferase [Chloroflexota bacterium]